MLHLVDINIPVLFEDFNIDRLFGAKNLDEVKEQVKTFVTQLPEVDKDGKNLYIFSPNNGNGKSAIAYYILSQMKGPRLNAQGSLFMSKIVACTFGDYLDICLKKFDKDVDQAKKLVDTAPYLLLDDVSPAFATGNAHTDNRSLLLLMNYRRRHKLPTIITSNLTPEHFDKFFGATASSKVLENFSFIEIVGKDMRPIIYESMFEKKDA